MGLDISIFLTYIGAILLVFIFGRLFLWPLKMILKLMISSLIGGLLIFVFNLIGSNFDVIMPLNICLLYTSPSPRDRQKSRMPSSA